MDSQDKHARDEALRAIQDNTERIEKHKRALEQHEGDLAREEKVLEQIRDSLKGVFCSFSSSMTE